MIDLSTLPDGRHEGIPEADYHADRSCVSNSSLTALSRSPLHYYTALRTQQKDTPALEFGRAFHCLMLEPDEFYDRHVVWSGAPRNTKTGKAEYAEALDTGKHPIRQADLETMEEMVSAIQATEAGRAIIGMAGAREVTYLWTDAETGIRCKCRVDWDVPDLGIFYDVKTTDDASPNGFQRSATKYNYHRQAAFYCDGSGHNAMGFIVVEKDAPYATGFYEPVPEFYDAGRAIYRKALATIKQCRDANDWPAYSQKFEMLELPAWAA